MGLLKKIFNTSVATIPAHQTADSYENKYFSGMEEIEAMWSVLYNLKIVTGEKADMFEQKCLQNISDFQRIPPANTQATREVPAYTRLAMLYEKQERYDEAIAVCVDAIRRGIVYDGSKGQMYGRLARLIRKSGKQVDSDIVKLAGGQK